MSSLVRPSGSAGSIHLRPLKSQLPASLNKPKSREVSIAGSVRVDYVADLVYLLRCFLLMRTEVMPQLLSMTLLNSARVILRMERRLVGLVWHT